MDRFSFRAAVHIAQAEFRQWLRSAGIIILFVMLVFVNVQVISTSTVQNAYGRNAIHT